MGAQAESHAQRDDQPRFLAGGSRRRPGAAQRTIRAVLSGEAALLPRRTRAVRFPQSINLHSTDRRAAGWDKARWKTWWNQHRINAGGRRSAVLLGRQSFAIVRRLADPIRL